MPSLGRCPRVKRLVEKIEKERMKTDKILRNIFSKGQFKYITGSFCNNFTKLSTAFSAGKDICREEDYNFGAVLFP
jgi:hypothetical protein